MKNPSTETSCHRPWDWIQATAIVMMNDLMSRIRWYWKPHIAWPIWDVDGYKRIKARVRFIRFNRFSDGESTDDFW